MLRPVSGTGMEICHGFRPWNIILIHRTVNLMPESSVLPVILIMGSFTLSFYQHPVSSRYQYSYSNDDASRISMRLSPLDWMVILCTLISNQSELCNLQKMGWSRESWWQMKWTTLRRVSCFTNTNSSSRNRAWN